MLKSRNLQPELMDQPGLDREQHQRALTGLATLNRFSNSPGILWDPIHHLCRQRGLSSLRVLDIASGGGDLAIALWRRAARAGVQLDILGCDISPTAVHRANDSARLVSPTIHFQQRDIFADAPAETFDIVSCSLFLHHLDHGHAVDLLRIMSGLAERLVLVNDLRRCLRGYVLAQAACHLLTRSPIVHVDGPRSVEAAFTISEVKEMCDQIPFHGATISKRWPFRFLLQWMVSDAV